MRRWRANSGPCSQGLLPQYHTSIHRERQRATLRASADPPFTPCVLLLLPLISTGRNTDLICEDNNPLDFGD